MVQALTQECNLFMKDFSNSIRHWLSHRPLLYGFIAGTGLVIFWRGIWHSMDFLVVLFTHWQNGFAEMNLSQMLWWDGPLSILIGSVILLFSGVFVSSFIGNEVILSGLRGEKKLTERTENELRTEAGAIARIEESLNKLKSITHKDL
jgi:energy-coupling factor transporter transmembrane protein EcfT